MSTAKRILVVEDDMIIQMFISRVLSLAGFKIAGEARNSTDALRLAELMQPDLVLMDIGLMGKMDGIETARAMNRMFDFPILFITGNSDEATINKARDVKHLGFVFKPIDEDRLLSMVEQVFSEE